MQFCKDTSVTVLAIVMYTNTMIAYPIGIVYPFWNVIHMVFYDYSIFNGKILSDNKCCTRNEPISTVKYACNETSIMNVVATWVRRHRV